MLRLKPNQEIGHFTLLSSRPVPMVKGVLHEWIHKKSGARLCYLERDDENKSFAIGFRTIPHDDTGVFHIIEHSVLCGSDKYPVKEPFVELLKGSLQTFLNALTYPDKTVYPLSTRNNKDFLNLINVYMDAVLHPAIYQHPEIFRQEGWHYELTRKNGRPSFKGVVFNEMKGAFASVDRQMDMAQDRLLFPDNCYSYCSGGNPKFIPTLTYEQFLEAHKTYYHPSNAFLFLDGDVDLKPVLSLLDSYLAPYDVTYPHTEIPLQGPVSSQTITIPYAITKDEDKKEKVHFIKSRVCGLFSDTKELLALQIISSILTSANESPLSRAVLESGLAQEIDLSVETETLQPYWTLEVRNTEKNRIRSIEAIVKKTLQKIVKEGIDKREILAELNLTEFRMRENDTGSFPKGLAFGLSAIANWMYGGDPVKALDVEEELRALREAIDTDYFETLIVKHFLADDSVITVIAEPSSSLTQKTEQEEKKTLASIASQWTEEDRERLCLETKMLLARQQKPDSKKNLATLPQLKLADVPAVEKDIPREIETMDNVTVLRHDIQTDGILYLRLFFDISGIPQEDLPIVGLMAGMQGDLDTVHYSARDLQREVHTYLGAFSTDVTSFTDNRYDKEDTTHLYYVVNASLLNGNLDKGLELIREVISQTKFEDKTKIKEILLQEKNGAQQSFIMRGHAAARRRLGAYYSTSGVINESLDGYINYDWLRNACKDYDTKSDLIIEKLQTLNSLCPNPKHLTISVTGDISNEDLHKITTLVPVIPDVFERTDCQYPPLGKLQEGISIPANIAFAVAGTNYPAWKQQFRGSLPVATQILSLDYLWNTVRVQSGAYGCGVSIARTGFAGFYSYRDPNPIGSINTYISAGKALTLKKLSSKEMTTFIIGTIAELSPLRTPRTSAMLSDFRYFSHITFEDMCRFMRELLETTPEDLQVIAQEMTDAMKEPGICIVADSEKLKACQKAGLIQSVLTL